MRRTSVFLSTCILLALASRVTAQSALNDQWPLNVYLEAGGNASWICCSANVDVMVARHVSVRAGVGGEVITDDSRNTGSSTVMVNGIFGPPDLALEIGAGLAHRHLLELSGQPSRIGPVLAIGLRMRGPFGQFGRLMFTPMLGPLAESDKGRRWFRPYFGISFGP